MPIPGRFRLPDGEIQVAARLRLRADIPRALKRHGPLTAIEIGNLMYWGRTPRNHRLGAKWWVNRSMNLRLEAIAALKRAGKISDGGRLGRRKLYHAKLDGGMNHRK